MTDKIPETKLLKLPWKYWKTCQRSGNVNCYNLHTAAMKLGKGHIHKNVKHK